MSADFIHQGHINIINYGAKFGKVVIGLLTDEAIESYKRRPIQNFDQRLSVISSIKHVEKVVAQTTLDYRPNLEQLKPRYVVHGDDWKSGIQSETRSQVIETLSKWHGELLEVSYTEGISSTQIIEDLKRLKSAPDIRLKSLTDLLEVKDFLRFVDVHSGISGLIIENTKVVIDNREIEFDGMWSSSLVDSTSRGMPDNESVDLTSRIQSLLEILNVTTKPIIFDGDTGGHIEHFGSNVNRLERLGVSAVIIEDKIGLKRNSLYGTEVEQHLDDPKSFGEKIKFGIKSRINSEFMIIARIESLIAGLGVQDALARAKVYVKSGASGIMIHSRSKDPEEVYAFMSEFKKFSSNVPIIVVPTTYNSVHEKELFENGAKVIIHANHLLRASYPAMKRTAENLLKYGRSKEIDSELMTIKEILNFVPER